MAPHCSFLTAVTLGSSGDAQVSARFGGYSLSLSLSQSRLHGLRVASVSKKEVSK